MKFLEAQWVYVAIGFGLSVTTLIFTGYLSRNKRNIRS